MSGIHQGKHALVTGGGTGIGEAIALALAGEGCTVTITGRRLEPLEQTSAKAKGIHPLVMDVSDEESVVKGTARAIRDHGLVDIHVANAGIAETSPFTKTPMDFWRKVMTTNLDGVFLSCREVLPGMLANGWGRIITISSIAGLRGLKYGAAYSASKHGVIGLTRVISEEFMHKGITANAICPGYVATPTTDTNIANIAGRTGIPPEKARAILEKVSPQQRLIQPEEVAAVIHFLCSAQASYINGAEVQINGGQHV